VDDVEECHTLNVSLLQPGESLLQRLKIPDSGNRQYVDGM
jgi:hypothetical protein